MTIYDATIPLADLNAAYLKANYLAGFTFFQACGEEFPDSFFDEAIANAISIVENFANIDILTRVILAEHHDYRISDYVAYGYLQLFHIPSQSCQEVRAVYPTGQTIQVFPTEWVRLQTEHSQIHLVPTSGTLSQVIIGHGADWLPLIYSGLGYLPWLWEVDYTSGFDPLHIPRIVVHAILKVAAIEILQIISDLLYPPGVTSQSLSVDGLSQSRGYLSPAFKARIDAYRNDVFGPEGLIKQIKQSYLGINLAAL